MHRETHREMMSSSWMRQRSVRALAGLVLTCAAPLVALDSDTSPLSAAQKSLREGAHEEAISGFRSLLAAEPGSPAAARGLCQALAAVGKTDEALEVLSKSPVLATNPDLLAARGRVELRQGKLAEAEASFRAALALKASHVESLNRLGETLAKRGRPDEASREWQKLVEVYQEMSAADAEALPPEGFVEMGLALIGLNRFKEAHDVMFSSARDKDAKCPELLLESGRILLLKYNYPDSRAELKDALEQNRNFADAHALLAENYLTDFQVGTKRYELALKSIDAALKVNPNHSEAHQARGTFEWTDGDIPAAAASFRRAVELDPSSLKARGSLAACHYLDAADDLFRKAEADALAINPRGAEFFHTIALLIESKFRYQDCVRFSDRALALDPEYWPAYVTLGINCLRTGEEERGRKFLDKSWERDKYNVWVFNTRTLLKHMDANYKELRTERFVFKFPKRDYEELSLYLAPLLDEAFTKLSAHYKTEIKTPVHVEVFSEHKWFSARTVGLEGFAASGACFGNLVTLTTPRALPQNWGAVAWHEFTHVVTLALTKHRVPRWLTEGLSVFEEGRDRPRWARGFERDIADQFASGRLLPIAQLDFGFSKPKYPNQILISYFQGCLIAQYIKERWSFDTILGILKGYGDNKGTAQIFQEVLGQSLEEFDRGFFEFVASWVEKNGYEPNVAPEKVRELQDASNADPKNARKLLDLGWGYYTSGNEVDAPIAAGKVLELDPSNADAHAILGLDAFRAKNLAKAKEELQKALDGKTRYQYRVCSTLGQVLLKNGDKEGALQLFERAREASPRAGAGYPQGKNLYYQIADLYMEQGKEDLAVERLEQLAEFAVEDPRCRQKIATHYLKKGDAASAARARQALDELLFLNPFDRGIHEQLARVGTILEDADLTIREYTYLLSFPETNPRLAYLALGRAHLKKGNREEARGFAEKLLKLDAGNREAQELLEKAAAP